MRCPRCQAWFEQALGVLAVLPESPSPLEQAFEIRLELRMVLNLLADIRQSLERLQEAEALAERLNDDRRRGRVYAAMTTIYALLGELDEALVTGARALKIAGRLGDLRLRILTTMVLELAYYSRGEYEQVVELATNNLAALPADWVHEYAGSAAPPSVHDRCWLVVSLAQLGRFAEAAQYSAEAIRLAEATHHAFSVGLAHAAAGTLHLLEGDWAKARSLSPSRAACARSSPTATSASASCTPAPASGKRPAAPHHRDDDVPRDGHAVLAGAGGGGDRSAALMREWREINADRERPRRQHQLPGSR